MTQEGDALLPAELQARKLIDAQLAAAGWAVVDRSALDLINHRGSAVREVPMAKDHGRADYLLYVDRRVVGVIEAKPIGTPLSGVQWQSAMYAEGVPADMNALQIEGRLPFVFEASGTETGTWIEVKNALADAGVDLTPTPILPARMPSRWPTAPAT